MPIPLVTEKNTCFSDFTLIMRGTTQAVKTDVCFLILFWTELSKVLMSMRLSQVGLKNV